MACCQRIQLVKLCGGSYTREFFRCHSLQACTERQCSHLTWGGTAACPSLLGETCTKPCQTRQASVDWYLAQYACILAGFVVAPIMESTSEAAIESICSRARPKLLIVTRNTEAKCRAAMQRGLGKSHKAYTVIIGGAAEVQKLALTRNDNVNKTEWKQSFSL